MDEMDIIKLSIMSILSILSIMSITSIMSIPSLMSIQTLPRLLPISTLTANVLALASKYFGLGQSIFFGLYGAKELALDGIVKNYKLQPLGNNPTWFDRTVHKIKNFMTRICLAHGSLYLLSAAAMFISELDTLKILSLGQLKTPVDFASNILFLGACALAIGYELIMIKQAINISKNGSDDEKKVTKFMFASSTMGIIGNIGYIIAVSTMMFGGPIIFAITLAVIAATIGCVKILFDYKFLSPALN